MPKTKRQINRLILILTSTVIFIAGFLLGKLYKIPYFELEKKINPVDIFSIVVTISLAIIITKYIEKEKEDTRTEKDLLIKRLDNIFDWLEDNKAKIYLEAYYQEVTYYIKKISTNINYLFSAIAETEIKANNLKSDINNSIKNIRDLMTNTPLIYDLFNNPITVEKNIIKYSIFRKNEIEVEHDHLIESLLRLQLLINKS